MILNGVNYPNQIIDAAKENKLVVFAGSGVSKEDPTALPNFTELVEMIAAGTQEKYDKTIACEVFLGNLKAQGINVYKEIIDIIKEKDIPNGEHAAIVSLFDGQKHIRIVTTNYDQMFEKAAKLCERNHKVFIYPALPFGDDIDGIVHLHGEQSIESSIIATDDDFGKAYMIDGNATRFIVKMLAKYTVLFIGYSYNDTILQYLTRAVSKDFLNNAFILAYEGFDRLSMLGLRIVKFRHKDFPQLTNSIKELAVVIKKKMYDWLEFAESISEAPIDNDDAFDSKIEYLLSHDNMQKVLLSKVKGEQWLKYFDVHGFIKPILDAHQTPSTQTELFAEWIINTIIGKADLSLLNIIANHGGTIHAFFADRLLNALNKAEIETDFFCEYFYLCKNYLRKDEIFFLTEQAIRKEIPEIAFQLFLMQFDFSIYVDRTVKNHPRIKLISNPPIDCIDETWKRNKNVLINSYAEELLSALIHIIEKITVTYLSFPNGELFLYDLYIVFDGGFKYLETNIIHSISEIICEVGSASKNINESYLKRFIITCLSSSFVLVRKIGFMLTTCTECFSPDEKIDLVFNYSSVYEGAEKTQVYHLILSIINKISGQKRAELLSKLKISNKDEYSKFDLCSWLINNGVKSPKLRKMVSIYKSEFGFIEKVRPELVAYSIEVNTSEEQRKAIDYLCGCTEDRLIECINCGCIDDLGEAKYYLYDAIAQLAANDISMVNRLIQLYSDARITNLYALDRICSGIVSGSYSFNYTIKLMEKLTKLPNIADISNIISKSLNKSIYALEKSTELQAHKEIIIEMLKRLYINRSQDYSGDVRLDVYNSTIGYILNAWIDLLKWDYNLFISECLKLFDNCLSGTEYEKEITIFILLKESVLLYNNNSKWYIETMIPFLSCNNQSLLCCAWKAISFISQLPYQLCGIIFNIMNDILPQITLADFPSKYFTGLYMELMLCISSSKKLKEYTGFDATKIISEYIPNLFKYASHDDRIEIVAVFERTLNRIGDNELIQLWNEWIKEFFENITKSKPTVFSNEEITGYYKCLPIMDAVYDDAVSTLLKGKKPDYIDELLRVLKSKNAASKHPRSTYELLLGLFNSGSKIKYYFRATMLPIISSLKESKEISDNMIIELENAMLNEGYPID